CRVLAQHVQPALSHLDVRANRDDRHIRGGQVTIVVGRRHLPAPDQWSRVVDVPRFSFSPRAVSVVEKHALGDAGHDQGVGHGASDVACAEDSHGGPFQVVMTHRLLLGRHLRTSNGDSAILIPHQVAIKEHARAWCSTWGTIVVALSAVPYTLLTTHITGGGL